MARNAMTDADKLLRRADFINAAHQLFREQKILPSVADIAKSAGLAKGTVYLYFKTKEEIFIALLEDDFAKLFQKLPIIIQQLPLNGLKAAEFFAKEYSQLIKELPDLLPLASISNGVLEQNLPIESMVRFKLFLASSLQEFGYVIEQKFSLKPNEGSGLLLRSYALTLGLWQSLAYPNALINALSPEIIKILKRDFNDELEQAIYQLWQGCLQPSTMTSLR